MTLQAGIRVVRGPDWKWGDQDGGEGGVGTVLQVFGCKSVRSTDGIRLIKCRTIVRWDSGNETEVNGVTSDYSIHDKHDLRILDSSSAGVQFVGTRCRECGSSSIRGTRWRCNVCEEHDLCTQCYLGDKHNLSHDFTRFDLPRDSGTPVPAREHSKKIGYSGIYTDAKVLRDVADWLKSGQDGGMGTLGVVIGKAEEAGMLRVKWEDRLLFDHHMGKDGKVDLWTLSPTFGGTYYLDHLALLDSSHFCEKVAKGKGEKESMTEIHSDVVHVKSSGGDEMMEKSLPLEKQAAWLRKSELNAVNEDYNDNDSGKRDRAPGKDLDIDDTSDCESDFSDALVDDVGSDDDDDGESDVSVVRGSDDDGSDEEGFFGSQHDRFLRALQRGGTGDGQFMDVVRRMMEDSGAGARIRPQRTVDRGSIAQGEVCRGERVLIDPDLDVATFERLQGEPQAGGWNRDMRHFIGKIGKVKDIVPRYAVILEFEDVSRNWVVNCKALVAKIYSVGDEVVVSDNETLVKGRQKDRGGWVPEMKKMLGKCFPVVSVEEDGSRLMLRYKEDCDLEVNPWSCYLEAAVEEANDQGGQSLEEVKKMLEEGLDPCAPVDVNGNNFVHSVILKSDNPSVLALLLDRYPAAGELVNFKLHSLLHCAVIKRRTNCVRLLFQRELNLNLKDLEGYTPLHAAIHTSRSSSHHDDIIDILTQPSRFDYSLVDERKLNVLQLAALEDHAYAGRRILATAPALLDTCKEIDLQGLDGVHHPLYLACCVGSLRFVKAVIDYDRSYLEKRVPNSDQTPLVSAICHKEAAIAEYLVLEGANVNVTRMNGDTCIHMIMGFLLDGDQPKTPMCNLEQAAEVMQIHAQLPADMENRSWIAMICFLVGHGANLAQANRRGVAPLQLVQAYSRGLPELLRNYYT